MKINPDAQARLAALQATQGVERAGGPHGKGGAQPATGAIPLAARQGVVGTSLPLAPPTTGTPLTLSMAARQLAGPPSLATLQWAQDVVEALTGLKLPSPTPRPNPAAQPAATQAAGPVLAPAHPGSTPRAPAPGSVADPDVALFNAQGSVLTADGQEFGFSLQLFAEKATSALPVPTLVSPVLARMLGSHPLMPPLTLRFAGPASALQSAVFEFQLEPSRDDNASPQTDLPAGVRLLGLLVFDPQMDATYNMHVAMASRNDPAAVLAAMGFHPARPVIGEEAPGAAGGPVCEETRCPYFGRALCPQTRCLRHGTAGGYANPDAGVPD